MTTFAKPALRIANCSGFYGDRFAAAREMVEGGPIDFLTGDYLAELTLLILWKNQRRDPSTRPGQGSGIDARPSVVCPTNPIGRPHAGELDGPRCWTTPPAQASSPTPIQAFARQCW